MANLKEFFLPLLLTVLIFYSLAFDVVSEDRMFIYYHIHITNDLPSNSILVLHCKSKNRDLGQTSLSLRQDFTFKTEINAWRTTLFFCHVTWDVKQRYFEGFRATRDEYRCKKLQHSCMWSVRGDGIYFSNDNSTWTNEYPW